MAPVTPNAVELMAPVTPNAVEQMAPVTPNTVEQMARGGPIQDLVLTGGRELLSVHTVGHGPFKSQLVSRN